MTFPATPHNRMLMAMLQPLSMPPPQSCGKVEQEKYQKLGLLISFTITSFSYLHITTVANTLSTGTEDAKNTPRRESLGSQNNVNGTSNVDKTLGHSNSTSNGENETTTRNSSTKSNKSNKSSKSGKGSPVREKIGLALINVQVSSPKPKPPRGMSERRHDMERRLVMLLVSIIVAFFITNIPTAVLSLTYREKKTESLSFQIFRAVANNLEFLNFGLNFVLYFLFSQDIRNAFMSILRRAVTQVKEGIEGSGSRSKYAATNL
ncbi:unnamed protein product, partial [Meganyctiphanes norvegica]